MAKTDKKKITLALDADILPWLNFEAGRRDLSVTGYLNTLVREDQQRAPEAVSKVFEAYMATREA